MSTNAQEGLEEHAETKSEPGWDRTKRVLAWCAIAGVIAQFVTSFAANQTAGLLIPRQEPSLLPEVPMLVTPIVSIIALILWKLEPVRAWSWLLLAGVTTSIPLALGMVSEHGAVLWLSLDTLAILAVASPILLLVSVVGAGTWLSANDMPRLGSVVVGASIAVQMVAFTVGNLLIFIPAWQIMSWILVVLLGLALIAGFIAVTTTHKIVDRTGLVPEWRVTVVGTLGILTSVIPVAMGVTIEPSTDTPYGLIGVLVLAVGLVLGFIAGWQSLLSAVALGFMNSVLIILLLPTIDELFRVRGLATGLLLISLVLGLVAAASKARSWIAVSGLTLVGTLFFLLMIGLDPASENINEVWQIATPVLVLLVIVSMVAALATVSRVLSANGATPAVVIGLAVPFQLAGLLFFLGLQLNVRIQGPPVNSLLYPTGIALLLAAGTLAMLVKRNQDSEDLGIAHDRSSSLEN